MATHQLKGKRPAPGHVWVDTDTDESGFSRRLDVRSEVLVLLRQRKNQTGLEVWELLVTRQDGSTYVDWENVDSVKEWYEYEPEYLKRVV